MKRKRTARKTKKSSWLDTQFDEFFKKHDDESHQKEQAFYLSIALFHLCFMVIFFFLSSWTYTLLFFLLMLVMLLIWWLCTLGQHPFIKIACALLMILGHGGLIVYGVEPIQHYAFKDKAKQRFCGELFGKRTQSRGRAGSITYWFIFDYNTEQRLKIVEPKRYKFFNQYEFICIDYAIDKKWSDDPYVFHVEKDFNSKRPEGWVVDN